MSPTAPQAAPRLPPRVLGVGMSLLALVEAVVGVLLLRSGQLAAAIAGGCLLAVATIAFVEAGLSFGRRDPVRAAALRGAARLALLCLAGVWFLGMVWLLVVLAFGRHGAAAHLVLLTALVLPVALVGMVNAVESQRALRAVRSV